MNLGYRNNLFNQCFLVLLGLLFIWTPYLNNTTYAETTDIFQYLDPSSQEMIVLIGEAKTLRVKNPQEVKIGNPGILDVTGASSEELLIGGKQEGETTLIIKDEFGQHAYTVRVVSQDLGKLKERIDILLNAAGFNDLNTQIGEREGKIFVTGKVSIAKKDSLESKLQLLQDKIINLVEYIDDTPSIEIDVEVLEINKTDLDNLGITWNKSISFSQPGRDLLTPKEFLKIFDTWKDSSFTATLNFLKQKNKAHTLSRPKIVCLSGKEANLLVGGQRPIISKSTTAITAAGTTTDYDIEMKDYGISLKIKPTVNNNGEIQIALNTEITDIDTTQSIQLTATVSTPGFTKRSAQTELTIMDGQTVFLAGLIQSQRTDNRDSIAGLGKIPLFGLLFRHKDLSQTDTEVVITLTPKIIKHQREEAGKSSTGAAAQVYSEANTAVVPSSREADPVVDYSTLIKNIIVSNLRYPDKLNNAQGSIKLSLHLLSTGKLLGVVIMQSSGDAALDESVESTVKRLSPFPSFPQDVKLKELWIDIPVVYNAG